MMGVLWLCGALIAVLAFGCAMVDPGANVREQPSLMHLWETYVHCRDSRDPDRMWADSQRLREAARILKRPQPSPWLSAVTTHAPSELPLRLSVDPDAMAVDCSLKAGRAARDQNRPRLAVTLFHQIATTYPVDRYGYYINQASRMLQERDVIGLSMGPSFEAMSALGSTGDPLNDATENARPHAIN
jgi:hypothetical protein